ncbi:hypothetical protein XENTR_v10015225 [Xenopus tropicalis]|nr:hypothetical protein XENTR_v10015225 [Xenopus tropicalis]
MLNSNVRKCVNNSCILILDECETGVWEGSKYFFSSWIHAHSTWNVFRNLIHHRELQVSKISPICVELVFHPVPWIFLLFLSLYS